MKPPNVIPEEIYDERGYMMGFGILEQGADYAYRISSIPESYEKLPRQVRERPEGEHPLLYLIRSKIFLGCANRYIYDAVVDLIWTTYEKEKQAQNHVDGFLSHFLIQIA